MPGRVLTVAESDSSGAAGIQADIKTILALGGYAMTALSAVTTQNTQGIENMQPLLPSFVAEQMRVALKDIGAAAIKTGSLINAPIVNAVGDVLDEYMGKGIPVVIDPALVTRQGTPMMDEEGIAALKRRLFIRATVLTPNLREAEMLTGMTIRDMADMRHACTMMRTLGADAVLLKAGATLEGKSLYLLATDGDEHVFERPLVSSRHTLGAGATLASGIAVSLSQGRGLVDAIDRAIDFMHAAILNARDFGTGDGPMNHAFAIEPSAEAPAKAARR